MLPKGANVFPFRVEPFSRGSKNNFDRVVSSLEEKRANFSVFRTFVRFALVWFYLFPLSVGVWEGLPLVIVPLPGLFS